MVSKVEIFKLSEFMQHRVAECVVFSRHEKMIDLNRTTVRNVFTYLIYSKNTFKRHFLHFQRISRCKKYKAQNRNERNKYASQCIYEIAKKKENDISHISAFDET